jgi:predicted metal-binding protein
MKDLTPQALSLGLKTIVSFSPSRLVPEEKIRRLCLENKCGNYNKHHMCPPRTGTLHEIESRLGAYRNGRLLQYECFLDVPRDTEGLRRSKLAFHRAVLQLEDMLRGDGFLNVLGLIGGDCALCDSCRAAARTPLPCAHPDRARASLEALGIDVLSLLESLGLDRGFHSDRVVWTGCLLF